MKLEKDIYLAAEWENESGHVVVDANWELDFTGWMDDPVEPNSSSPLTNTLSCNLMEQVTSFCKEKGIKLTEPERMYI